ncbi:Hypothetical protein FKW44_001976 [Caligus rogercresseyi]|uniref:Uncharacterized protein n=1 Tax=Caligus rogercresseyi TaxID=217165 RepID=A0A7T8KJV2_CALRO|nr:Hypothetical protein FKW44_001976 [Caligus rogercresseyi]
MPPLANCLKSFIHVINHALKIDSDHDEENVICIANCFYIGFLELDQKVIDSDVPDNR